MSAEASPPPSKNGNGESGPTDEEGNGMYECNICLDTANDAVVTMCGHLFW